MSKSDHRERYAVFAKALRRARKEAGLTQTTVAKRLGRPQSYVSKYESCERRLDVIEFLEITRAINCDWETFLGDVFKRVETGLK